MKIDRRDFISGLGAVAASGAITGTAVSRGVPKTDAPNILVLIADDAGWKDFGCYGNRGIATPAIDRLAEEGLLCEKAFLTAPQCSPSRISVLTGRYPHATGAEDLHMPLPEGETFLPAWLKDAGYFTGHMRKTHYGKTGEAQFDWYSGDVRDFPAFLDQSSDRPFFMWTGFSDPHRPYDRSTIEHRNDEASVTVPPQLVDDPETRADLADYYDEISRMDSEIGNMLDELEKKGKLDNTLVVFFSDNGMPFPGAKGTLYDTGIRTPMIFRWPGKIRPGSRFSGLVSSVDLAPTIMEIAGIPVPASVQGKSMREAVLAGTGPGREYVFSERNWHDCDEHMRSVRTSRYKMILNAYTELPFGNPADVSMSPSWHSLMRKKGQGALTPEQARIFTVPRPSVEFFDLENDPGEFRNLAGNAEYASEVRKLGQVLDKWKEETGDFSPWERRRGDHTDRITGIHFSSVVPEMY